MGADPTERRVEAPGSERVYVGAYCPGEWLVSLRDEGTGGTWRDLRRRDAYRADGFAWGYRGAEPAVLARALLADALGRPPAEHETVRFMREVVCSWPMRGFRITRSEIAAWLAAGDGALIGHVGGP